jgi:hypothetical protein
LHDVSIVASKHWDKRFFRVCTILFADFDEEGFECIGTGRTEIGQDDKLNNRCFSTSSFNAPMEFCFYQEIDRSSSFTDAKS